MENTNINHGPLRCKTAASSLPQRKKQHTPGSCVSASSIVCAVLLYKWVPIHLKRYVAEQAEGPTSDSLSRVVLGALPRGHKVKPLVAEFGHYITVYVDPQQPALTDKFVAQQPKGAKIVSRRIVTRGESQAAHSGDAHVFLLDLGQSEMIEKVHIGVPSEPDVFIQRALEAGHPRSLDQYGPADGGNAECNFF